MYKISDLIKDYKSLQEDYNLLQSVYKKMVKSLLETSDIEDLILHNRQYQDKLVSLVQNNFPATAADVADWSKKEWSDWLDLLREYPIFWLDKQENLIGLFWSLDGKGILAYENKVVLLCTHLQMADYVADLHHEVAVKTLWALINKYASSSLAEQFQNRVDLAINQER